MRLDSSEFSKNEPCSNAAWRDCSTFATAIPQLFLAAQLILASSAPTTIADVFLWGGRGEGVRSISGSRVGDCTDSGFEIWANSQQILEIVRATKPARITEVLIYLTTNRCDLLILQWIRKNPWHSARRGVATEASCDLAAANTGHALISELCVTVWVASMGVSDLQIGSKDA